MTATRQDIPILDYAKERAKAIVTSYSDDDLFQVLTHDFEGKHQRFVSKEDALNFIDEIKVTPSVQTMDKIMTRQKQLFETVSGNKISYVLSDFQKSITNFEMYRDTMVEFNLLPIQTIQQRNLSVDSVWMEGPIPVLQQNNKLLVRVRNNSVQDAEEVKLTFRKDGQEKPISLRDIGANSSITDTVILTLDKPGWQHCVVSVNDYPVQFDDNYYISFEVPDTIKALFINEAGPNRYMEALFKGIKHFTLADQNASRLQYQQFTKYNLIILNDLKSISTGLSSELGDYMRNGGKVLVFPSKDADISSYNIFLAGVGANAFTKLNRSKKEVSQINTEEFIFADVFENTSKNLKLPVTSLSYDLTLSSSGVQEKILTFRDASSYLVKNVVGDGQLFVCTSPLDNEVNDLVYNAEIFVPMVYKMAIATLKQKKLAYTITNSTIIETENKRKTGDYVYKVTNGKDEIIPGQLPAGNTIKLDLGDQIKVAGFYDLILDENIVGKAAFNYDRKESDMSIYEEGVLERINPENSKIKIISSALQANISGTISEKDKGIVLWKWFVFAVLIFLAIETLLLRFYKV
jgi:hypothetical protein